MSPNDPEALGARLMSPPLCADCQALREEVAAALYALAEQRAAAGMPREPTQEMEKAGWAACHGHTNGTNHLLAGGIGAIWYAMHDAWTAAHPPQESDVENLRDVLRSYCIANKYGTRFFCSLCEWGWDIGLPEAHASHCLAALPDGERG